MIRAAATTTRLLAIGALAGLIGCHESTPRVRPALNPGTYDLILPLSGATSWSAPVPPQYNTSNLGCARYVDGWYIIGSDGSVEAHRVFQQGTASWKEVAFGHVRQGAESAAFDYGEWEERGFHDPEDRGTALSIAHHFRGSGSCSTTHHKLWYALRAGTAALPARRLPTEPPE